MLLRFLLDPETGEPPQETPMKRNNENFPEGWDQQRVREVLDYYEGQTDDEAAAEHEAALVPSATLMKVPADLVPQVRELIAKH